MTRALPLAVAISVALAIATPAGSAHAQVVCGDLDADGDVDADDALILRRHLARVQVMDASQEARCNSIDEARAYEIIAPACSQADAVVMGRVGQGLPPAAGALCGAALAISNPVTAENALPGSQPAEWEQPSLGTPADPLVMGFTHEISVNKGEPVHFKISVDPGPIRVRLRIFRLGWYGGLGARLMATAPDLMATTQPPCTESATPSLSATGFDELQYPGADAPTLFSCANWSTHYTWTPPSTIASGVYIAQVTRLGGGGAQTRIPFIVRDDARHSDILVQVSDTSWHAYNASPLYHVSGPTAAVEGHSLYDYPTFIADSFKNPRAYKVSYDRSHVQRYAGVVVNNQESGFFGYEYPLIRFLEAQGFDVAYTTGRDSDARGNLIRNHRLFVTVGHDEYWSGAQRDQVEAARDAGVHLAFFSGNSAFWKVRWEDAFHTLVCFKEPAPSAFDPKLDPLPGVTTAQFRDGGFGPPLDGHRPENALLGQLTSLASGMQAVLTVSGDDAQLRFWRNTSVASTPPGGTANLGANGVRLLGFELDGDADNGFRPVGLFRVSSSLLDSSTVIDGGAPVPGLPGSLFEKGWTSVSHGLTLYRAASGALVFAAGTIQLPFALSYYNGCAGGGCPAGVNGQDTAARQAIVNLFADMGVQPTTLEGGLSAATQSTDSIPPDSVITSHSAGASVEIGDTVVVSGTASDSGGHVAAVELSTDGGVTWHPAEGRAQWRYRFSPCSVGPATLAARAVDDSGNLGAASALVPISIVSTGAANLVRNGLFDCGFDSVSDAHGVGFGGLTGLRGSSWFHWSNSGIPAKLDDAGVIGGVHLQRVWAGGAGDGIGQHPVLEVGKSYRLEARVFVEACPPDVTAPCAPARAHLGIGLFGAGNSVLDTTSFVNRWETLRVDYTPTQAAATFVIYSDFPNTVFKVDEVTLVEN